MPVLLFILALLLPLTPANANDALDEIVVVGERSQPRSALETSRPVDVLTAEEIQSAAGQTQVGKILRNLLPSFHTPDSTISDGTDSLRPAALRGLGPDQTLVLINGKRRHSSALVHVNGSYGRGTAGVDFAAIPAAAIGSVEVLRDGAAAQYGSDAIAGVINIRMARREEGTGALVFQSGQTYEGDGARHYFSAAGGLDIGGMAATLSGEISLRDSTYRGGRDGTCQYSAACDDPREATFDRHSFRIGDADADAYALTFDGSHKTDSGAEIYGFALASLRESQSGGFYRISRNPNNNVAVYPHGFLPLINTDILDIAFASGAKGTWGDFLGDVSFSYALNQFDFFVSNSLNATYALPQDVRTSADSGGFELEQIGFNLDLAREVMLLERPGAIAFGAELRRESYAINAGEPYSYLRCHEDAAIPDDEEATRCRDAAPGIQVFPGFSPDHALYESRVVLALYGDGEIEPRENLFAGLAARYEYYDDAGGNIALHGRGRYEVSQTLAVRGSLGTGFRAPSLQQTWFNSTSTQFNNVEGVDVRSEVGTFNASHQISKSLGIPELEPEESLHLAAGVVFRPRGDLSITLDAYQIDVDDRIALSSRISSARDGDNNCLIGGIDLGSDDSLCLLYESENITGAQFFINLAETQTRGIDLVLSVLPPLPARFDGEINLSLAYADTDIKGGIATPGELANVPGLADVLFNANDRALIEDAAPNVRATLAGNLAWSNWRMRAGVRHYGAYSITEGDTQKFSAKTLFDMEVAYVFNAGLTIALGAENLFDTTPDKTTISTSRSCSAQGVQDGTCYVESSGVFVYNRRSAPFGFNGGFYYLRLTQDF